MAVTRSGKSNSPSPRDGNSLSLFVDGADNILKLKDIYGNIQDISDFVSVGSKGEKGEIGATGFRGATGATGNQVYISINIKITIFKRFIKKQCVQIQNFKMCTIIFVLYSTMMSCEQN